MEHAFGGDWTKEKLSRVSKYLSAYVQILKNKDYHYVYIDAFAGTGYVNPKNVSVKESQGNLFPELAGGEGKDFIEGSAKIALEVSPQFREYFFIDKDPIKAKELESLKGDYPEADISIVSDDANCFLKGFCQHSDWEAQRAVIFLDPYGMQIPWSTIQDIANTSGTDLWYLFPAGIAINRLLRRDGRISDSIRERLDNTFGSNDWFDLFYQTNKRLNLFGEDVVEFDKIANLDDIKNYFLKRLEEIFPSVAPNPLWLVNSRKTPLYLLCFACSNPHVQSAVKIAQHILEPSERKKPGKVEISYPTIPGLNL